MRKSSTQKQVVGEIRPSQILTTYGIGGVVDLPNISVMVMGLDAWDVHQCTTIPEERLLASVKEALGNQVQSLKAPPIPENDHLSTNDAGSVGIPVNIFPRWMVCPRCRLLAPLSSEFFTLKYTPYRPDHTRYVHTNCTKSKMPSVLPARFVVACEHGHMDDFPWSYFVHRGEETCPGSLRLRENGIAGEAIDVYVSCDSCGKTRTMAQAFGNSGEGSMPLCRGRRPQLRDYAPNGCDLQMRTILLGASNSWFSNILSALSLPINGTLLDQLVERYWGQLFDLQSEREVTLARRGGDLGRFNMYTDDEIFTAITARQQIIKTIAPSKILPLKVPEWNIFTNPTKVPPTDDFQMQATKISARYSKIFDQIVLLNRLREVRALTGFTRITSQSDGDISTKDYFDTLAPLARSAPSWVPATEVRGEGIFLQFNETMLQKWAIKAQQHQINRDFYAGHQAWCQNRGIDILKFLYPTMRYVLLHSFAHALMRQFALDCGYTAASLNERIYSIPQQLEHGPMAGVLIYTAATDSEGTLGGLVRLGAEDELEHHINSALETLYWCSSDPLCSIHKPTGLTVHGAACHACLFAPETSCERGNRFLDRRVLIPTIDSDNESELPFFPFALQTH